jgi:Phospholipase_D-nuclease N-terminal
MEFLGTLFGAYLAWKLVIAVTAGLLFPAFWIWMIIDAVLRDTTAFQSRSTNEKLIWILAIAFLHVVSIVYFFVIWLPARNRVAAPNTAAVSA